MLEKEFQYYKEHQDELVKKHNGKYLAIVGESIAGVFNSELEAYSAMKEKAAPGTFLIQLCTPGKDSFTQTFHSRVSFP